MKQYRHVVRLLKEKFPLAHPVHIRRVHISANLDGDCQFKKDCFLIRINSGLSESEAIEALLHEYGHILSWNVPGDEHGAQWGKAYSRVYRCFLKNM